MSSLMISEEKVKKALEQGRPLPFTVTGPELSALAPTKQDASVSGTVSISDSNEQARRMVLEAFKRIDTSGTVLKNEEELNAEINEMRRRNL